MRLIKDTTIIASLVPTFLVLFALVSSVYRVKFPRENPEKAV